MKVILLLRHAKSSWSDPSLNDFDRPLANRGLKDAPRMGKFLKKINYCPQYVVSSTAMRARQTTQRCLKAMNADERIVQWENSLYFEGLNKYFEAINQAPETAETIMLVGHNPLIEAAASFLSGGKEHPMFKVPTAGLVCLESYADRWSDLTPGTCHIKWMMIPKVVREIVD